MPVEMSHHYLPIYTCGLWIHKMKPTHTHTYKEGEAYINQRQANAAYTIRQNTINTLVDKNNSVSHCVLRWYLYTQCQYHAIRCLFFSPVTAETPNTREKKKWKCKNTHTQKNRIEAGQFYVWLLHGNHSTSSFKWKILRLSLYLCVIVFVCVCVCLCVLLFINVRDLPNHFSLKRHA